MARPVNVVLRFLLHADGKIYQQWVGRPGLRPVDSEDIRQAVYEEYMEMAQMARAQMEEQERAAGLMLMKGRRKRI